MTFKHTKFEDSPIMRSLEKVAQEKGLIKADSIQKNAFTKADIIPNTNLMNNILKLCAGLRSKGFDKYADDLEVKLLNYKQAQTMYETSKETGEDLIQAAHPKGSHKLENVDSKEATVEDILDVHLKMTEVVGKRPTGKLSTAAGIKAIKKALGQEADPNASKRFNTQILDQVYSVMQLAASGLDIARKDVLKGFVPQSVVDDIAKALSPMAKEYTIMNSGEASHFTQPSAWLGGSPMAIEGLISMFRSPAMAPSDSPTATGPDVRRIGTMVSYLRQAQSAADNIGNTVEKDKIKNTFTSSIKTLESIMDQIRTDGKAPVQQDKAPETNQSEYDSSTDIIPMAQRYVNYLQGYKSVINSTTYDNSKTPGRDWKKEGIDWIDNEIAELTRIASQFSLLSMENRKVQAENYHQILMGHKAAIINLIRKYKLNA